MRKRLVILLLALPATARAWTVEMDFDAGPVGERVSDHASNLGSAGGTYYSDAQSYSGSQSAELNNERGREGFGRWGGVIGFPSALSEGDEIWWRVRCFWPAGVTYDANPRLKFLRLRTNSATGDNRGYNDWYINNQGSSVPFQFIKEAEPNTHWSTFGTSQHAIERGVWETYELYVYYDDQSVDDGGQGRVRAWKNGELLLDSTDHATLVDADDVSPSAFLFTYWNSGPFERLFLVANPQNFQLGEMATGPTQGPYEVTRIDADAVVLYDQPRSHKPDIAVGEVITGQTSGATATVIERRQAYPTADVLIYVDDLLITTDTPSSVDEAGNPFIGVGADSIAPAAPSNLTAE